MARDSRSLRSGLSNAELLAKDMNALQTLVTKHLGPKAHAMYWDDMVNPDHNGTYHSQATSRLNSNTHLLNNSLSVLKLLGFTIQFERAARIWLTDLFARIRRWRSPLFL